MGMRQTVLSAAAALALTAASVSALAALVQKPGTETWTPPSGEEGASHADVLTTADYYGLQIVTLFQYAHRPCSLGVEESTLATHDLARLEPLMACEPSSGELWKRVDVGAGNYVTGVATCIGVTKDDKAIHGIELFSASLEADGKLKPSKSGAKVEFSECRKWQPKRSCPAGAVATALRAYWSDADHGVTGLALRCHAVTTRGQ
jgi:hypothetical protein